jgi:L-alanine-DL-glutamate epimerase-like enolase superfamily enzyme
MKITALTPLVLGTPWRNLTLVKVETDSGIYGLGESVLPTVPRRCWVISMKLCSAMLSGEIRLTSRTFSQR